MKSRAKALSLALALDFTMGSKIYPSVYLLLYLVIFPAKDPRMGAKDADAGGSVGGHRAPCTKQVPVWAPYGPWGPRALKSL